MVIPNAYMHIHGLEVLTKYACEDAMLHESRLECS